MAEITLTLFSKCGKRTDISESVSGGNTICSLQTLHKSLIKVKEETNDILTEMVNAEKIQSGVTGTTTTGK